MFVSNIICLFAIVCVSVAQLPGGVQEADANDDYATNLLWAYVLPKYNLESNNAYNSVPDMSTLKLRKQVVSGMNYFYDVHMVESTCAKSAGNVTILQRTTCVARAGGRDEVCSITLWEQAWLNHTEVTQMSCQPANGTSTMSDRTSTTKAQKPPVLGGQVAADSNDADIQSLLWNYIVKKYNSESNAIVYFVPDMVTVHKQVVAGILYTFNVHMRESTCTKYQQGINLYVLTTDGSCAPADDGRTDECTVKIVEQPWLNRTEITSYHCTPQKGASMTTLVPSNTLSAVIPK